MSVVINSYQTGRPSKVDVAVVIEHLRKSSNTADLGVCTTSRDLKRIQCVTDARGGGSSVGDFYWDETLDVPPKKSPLAWPDCNYDWRARRTLKMDTTRRQILSAGV